MSNLLESGNNTMLFALSPHTAPQVNGHKSEYGRLKLADSLASLIVPLVLIGGPACCLLGYGVILPAILNATR